MSLAQILICFRRKARDKDPVLASRQHSIDDPGNLFLRFSRPIDDLRYSLADTSVVIHLGKAEFLERRILELHCGSLR